MEYVTAKTIVYKDKSSAWFGSDYKMNIYRGCCHGCIYCDSRSDCYRIDDFDKVHAKENALEIIRNDLRRKVRKGVIVTGAASDPYNPFEEKLLLTRHSLELINAYEFGVGISTKSPLITRDIDVLGEIAEHSPVIAKMTITAADDKISKLIEPNVAPSSQRFEALKKLADNGIYSGILMMPILPYVTDSEENILKIIDMAAESGAKFIYAYFGLTMRAGQREYMYQKLDESFPGLKQKYIRYYGDKYQCASKNSRKLYNIFKAECEKRGILYKMADIIKSYRMGYENTQLKFF